ncbi:hypothetical protein HDU96_000574 [Phlyctochytrium bullatum]|nr:hypothetical protein HDU96_000574 [Phlyctochytrium bullatum]
MSFADQRGAKEDVSAVICSILQYAGYDLEPSTSSGQDAVTPGLAVSKPSDLLPRTQHLANEKPILQTRLSKALVEQAPSSFPTPSAPTEVLPAHQLLQPLGAERTFTNCTAADLEDPDRRVSLTSASDYPCSRSTSTLPDGHDGSRSIHGSNPDVASSSLAGSEEAIPVHVEYEHRTPATLPPRSRSESDGIHLSQPADAVRKRTASRRRKPPAPGDQGPLGISPTVFTYFAFPGAREKAEYQGQKAPPERLRQGIECTFLPNRRHTLILGTFGQDDTSKAAASRRRPRAVSQAPARARRWDAKVPSKREDAARLRRAVSVPAWYRYRFYVRPRPKRTTDSQYRASVHGYTPMMLERYRAQINVQTGWEANSSTGASAGSALETRRHSSMDGAGGMGSAGGAVALRKDILQREHPSAPRRSVDPSATGSPRQSRPNGSGHGGTQLVESLEDYISTERFGFVDRTRMQQAIAKTAAAPSSTTSPMGSSSFRSLPRSGVGKGTAGNNQAKPAFLAKIRTPVDGGVGAQSSMPRSASYGDAPIAMLAVQSKLNTLLSGSLRSPSGSGSSMAIRTFPRTYSSDGPPMPNPGPAPTAHMSMQRPSKRQPVMGSDASAAAALAALTLAESGSVGMEKQTASPVPVQKSKPGAKAWAGFFSKSKGS